MGIEHCLCSSCSRNCGNKFKTEMALRGKLTYIYLNNGTKITNLCSIYSRKAAPLKTDRLAGIVNNLKLKYAQ